MQTFTMAYGNQTFRGSSGKVNVFSMVGDNSSRKEFPDRAFPKIGGMRAHASKDSIDSHGFFYPTTYEGEDGGVLMLRVSTTRHGKSWADAMMFVCLRESADMVTIKSNLPEHRDAASSTIVTFSGRADILTREELPEHGVLLYPNELSRYFDEEELEELFTVETLLTGTAKPKMVSIPTEEGRVKVVKQPTQAGRRLRIRRS